MCMACPTVPTLRDNKNDLGLCENPPRAMQNAFIAYKAAPESTPGSSNLTCQNLNVVALDQQQRSSSAPRPPPSEPVSIASNASMRSTASQVRGAHLSQNLFEAFNLESFQIHFPRKRKLRSTRKRRRCLLFMTRLLAPITRRRHAGGVLYLRLCSSPSSKCWSGGALPGYTSDTHHCFETRRIFGTGF